MNSLLRHCCNAKADEMVSALIYFASDASIYVGDHNIIVDEGLTAW